MTRLQNTPVPARSAEWIMDMERKVINFPNQFPKSFSTAAASAQVRPSTMRFVGGPLDAVSPGFCFGVLTQDLWHSCFCYTSPQRGDAHVSHPPTGVSSACFWIQDAKRRATLTLGVGQGLPEGSAAAPCGQGLTAPRLRWCPGPWVVGGGPEGWAGFIGVHERYGLTISLPPNH